MRASIRPSRASSGVAQVWIAVVVCPRLCWSPQALRSGGERCRAGRYPGALGVLCVVYFGSRTCWSAVPLLAIRAARAHARGRKKGGPGPGLPGTSKAAESSVSHRKIIKMHNNHHPSHYHKNGILYGTFEWGGSGGAEICRVYIMLISRVYPGLQGGWSTSPTGPGGPLGGGGGRARP